MKNNTNKYVNEIWSLYQKYAHSSGMGNYGIGLESQRSYYTKLTSLERNQYEDAVLDLCRSDDVQKSNVGLYLCSEMADVFPSDWINRVTPLVETLVYRGLQAAYENTITYAILRLIWSFNISSLKAFAKVFNRKITIDLKQGVLPTNEWTLLYSQTSRILIKLSPKDFWDEFKVFHEDQVLLNLLDSEVKTVIFTWSSFGALCHGLEWLKRLVTEYSRNTDAALRTQALSSIEQSSSIVVSTNSATREAVKEFLQWAKEKLSIQ